MDANLKSIMTADPACCTPDTPLRDVAQMMAKNDCGGVPIIDGKDTRKPLGMVTDRDITVRMVAEGRETGTAKASDCMTTPVTTIPQGASLADCAKAMEQNQIRRVVVVDDNGAVCGIVAQADIALSGRDRTTGEMVQQVSRPAH